MTFLCICTFLGKLFKNSTFRERILFFDGIFLAWYDLHSLTILVHLLIAPIFENETCENRKVILEDIYFISLHLTDVSYFQTLLSYTKKN